MISTSLSESEPEDDSDPEDESDDDGTAESDEPADSASETADNGVDSSAACKTLISDCNSSIAPWQGHALGEEEGIFSTGSGIERQFPFPSLRYPTAQEIDDSTDYGTHPPFPSETKLCGHFGEVTTVNGVSADGTVGTHPPCPSVSYPVAQEIVEAAESDMQFPAPSLVYPDGQTDGSGDELGIQFPFPSLWNPDAQKRGTEEATQFPFPSLVNPLEQTATDGAGVLVIKIHPPCPSVVYPDAQDVNYVSSGTHAPSPSLVYPDGHTDGTETESGRHDPLPLLWNPELQMIGMSIATQFPYPSVYYPVGQLTVVGGFLVSIGTQLPLLEVNPEAHETELAGGRQFPYPSVEKPDGQSEGKGLDIISGTHYELLSLWNPELQPDDYGTEIDGVYGVDGVALSQQHGQQQH